MLYDCVTISNDLGVSYCEQRRLIGFWMIVGYLELKVCFYTRLLLWSFDGYISRHDGSVFFFIIIIIINFIYRG